MDWIIWLLFIVPVAGLVIAYFEHKRKNTFLKHDNTLDKKSFWLKQRIEKQTDPFELDKW